MTPPGPAPSGNLPAVRPLTTPESSTGTPRYLSPSAVAPETAPTMGGQLTPSSRFGTPAAPPPTFRMPIGPPLVSAIGALAANQPTEAQVNERLNNPLTLKELATAAQQYLWPQTDTQTRTQTQSGPGSSPSGPVPPSPPPPFGPAGPSNYLPPFNRGPIPAYLPQHGPQRAPSIQQQGGGGGGGPASPGMIQPSDVDLGHYRQTVGNARTPTWVPGGMDAPAPQIFRGPTTAWGAPNSGNGPRGSQNYYQPGSAPMAPGDWTGTGPVAGPLAAFAANVPSAQAQPVSGRGGAPSGYAPNAAMMNNAAAGDQMMGSNTFAGGRGGAPPMPPPRPTPGGFGYNPLSFFGAGP